MPKQARSEITQLFWQAVDLALIEDPYLSGAALIKAIQNQLHVVEKRIPQGSNGLSALAMFDQRMFYKQTVYPSQDEAPTPFDLWYERPLFGKVAPDGDPIFAPQNHMKQLAGGNGNVWVVDFVADAFNDFKKEFLFLNKKTVDGTPFALLIPERGWISVIVEYNNYMDMVYNLFVRYIGDHGKDSEIVSFDKFMNLFYRFAEINSPHVPITLSQYIASPFCSPAASGLMLDISLDTHGNDTDKYNHFINDDNFICFAETAERFGFKIDKNFPGRLIADIKSPVMTREGDPGLPPSRGGEGYMRKYPKAPPIFKKTRPSPPELVRVPEPTRYPEIAFEIGDEVQFISRNTVQTSNQHHIILRNFTELKNRSYGLGVIPRTIIDDRVADAPIKKDAFLLMAAVGTTGWYGGASQIYTGKVVAIDPDENERRNTWGTWVNNSGGGGGGRARPQIAIIQLEAASAGWMVGQSSIDFNTLQSIWSPTTHTIGGTTLEIFIDSNGLDWGNKTKQYPDNFKYGNSFPFVEVPLDALHMIKTADMLRLERFHNRVSYPAKKALWEQKMAVAQKLYDDKVQDFLQRVEPAWLAAKAKSDKDWLFYRTAPRLAAYNLFQSRYNKAYLFDMSSLKEICMQFYYSYTADNPVATVSKLVNCGSRTRITEQKIIKREQISRDLMERKYSDTYWLKQYILIRNAESEDKRTFDALRLIRRRAIEVYNQRGVASALKYIKKQIPVLTYETLSKIF